MTEWYRRKTWTKIDEEEFFTKLGRARLFNRAQYLRAQAIELVYTKNNELLKVAETLLKKILLEYPDDNSNRGCVLYTLGEIYKLNGNYNLAIDFYKQALDFEQVFPSAITQAYLNYSELIVKTNKTEFFKELEEILLAGYSGLLFPIEKYKVNSILSILNTFKGQKEKAKQYAALAEQYAIAETSGLRYHKSLGLVDKRDTWFDNLVRKR